MNLRTMLIVLVSFLLGMLLPIAIISASSEPKPISSTTSYVIAGQEDSSETKGHFITRILGLSNEERPSPYDWISESEISVEKDKVVIRIDNAQWSKFTDTNSMDPVIDSGANAIQVVPRDSSQIHIGDIISYESDFAEGTIIHRVIETGRDEKGWYCTVRGDNNPSSDPGKIRFSQIRRVVVAIIY